MSAVGERDMGGLQGALEEGVVGPLEKRLAFSEATVFILMPWWTATPQSTRMASKGAPPADLYSI